MMKHKLFLPLFVLAAGVLGAWLRAWNMGTGYELGTGLPIGGNVYFTALLALSGVFAVFVFFFAARYRQFKGHTFERAFRCIFPAYKVLSAVSGGIMILAGVYGAYSTVNNMRSDYIQTITPVFPAVILCGLTILTGVSIIVLTSAQSKFEISEGSAMCSLVPLFWACFDLFMTYRENGANPVLAAYAFELLAAIAIMYAFYAMASFLYSKGNPPRFLISASLAVYLIIVSVGGGLLSFLFFGENVVPNAYTLMRYLSFGACAVFLQSNLFIITRNMNYLDEIGNVDFSDDDE